MRKIAIFPMILLCTITCNSKPLAVGVEYKCTTVAIHRFMGNKIEEIKVPSNAKSFYISERNNSLIAKYKEAGASEVSDNNAILLKTEITEDQGRKFDTSFFIKKRNDGENQIQILKEINVQSKIIAMVSFSKYTELPGMLRMIHQCI